MEEQRIIKLDRELRAAVSRYTVNYFWYFSYDEVVPITRHAPKLIRSGIVLTGSREITQPVKITYDSWIISLADTYAGATGMQIIPAENRVYGLSGIDGWPMPMNVSACDGCGARIRCFITCPTCGKPQLRDLTEAGVRWKILD